MSQRNSLDLDDVSVGDLQLFASVCESRSLSDVARDIGCTQPAVSQRVRRLERAIGSALLDRSAKGVEPTDAGVVLYEAIVEGLGTLRAAARRIEQLRSGESGSVRTWTDVGPISTVR